MIRKASHAGSWYSSSGPELASQLDSWLDEAKTELESNGASLDGVRAIIAPHAGYRFSGRTAGYSYAGLRAVSSSIKRIYVLGPSHHVHSTKCMLTLADRLDTPLGPLKVDKEEITRLSRLENFTMWSSIQEDEDEHSVEMQLPYIKRAMAGNESYMVVPITVGSITFAQERMVGELLAACIDNSENAVVISSDFCHWGSRFRYQYLIDSTVPIHESIKRLDHQGMELIESKDHKRFSTYLKSFQNTICGRHPIGVLLGVLDSMASKDRMVVQFVHYEQSSPCATMKDSSVSYAAALITMRV